jgi:murein DD-endopeptidase MepM/ murein hydrolase activator NlpD
LTAKLPFWAFTNARNGRYEAYLILASTKNDLLLKSSKTSNNNHSCFTQTICPTSSCEITSHFNLNRIHPVKKAQDGSDTIIPHYGTDFRALKNTPVYAVASGKVNYIKAQKTGWGLYIIIEHDNPHSYSLYAHLSETLVKVGENVAIGQQIAKSGDTGIGTGAHLHFEFRSSDWVKAVNQESCIYAPFFEVVPKELIFEYKDDLQMFTIKATHPLTVDEVTSSYG